MNRFRTLLSGAALCAATATSLWAQVPVVQPSQVSLQPIRPAEIPIVSPGAAASRELTLPAIPVVSPNKPAEIPIILSQALNAKEAARPLLPTIIRPGDSAAVKGPATNQGPEVRVPIVRNPLMQSREPAGAVLPPTPQPALGGQLKTEHPDISLPTGVPIVQARSGAEAAGSLLQKESSEPKPAVEEPIAAVDLPSEVVPSVVVPAAGVAEESARVSSVPIVSNPVPIVKTAGSESMANAAKMPESSEALASQQDSIQVPITRPEVALPPIRPGEEFPRTPRQLPANSASGLQANPAASSVSAQTGNGISGQTNAGTRFDFEQVPVGAGLVNSSQIKSQQASAIVQPAAPVTGQSQVEVGPVEIGPEASLQLMPGEYSAQGLDTHYGHVHEEYDPSAVGQSYLQHGGEGECSNCGGAGCSHCGMGGWNGLGNREFLNVGGGCENGCFGLMPCAQNYFIADVLYWTRNGGDVVGTNFGGVYDYDWNFGTMVTMGTRVDPLYGHELTYFGLFDLNAGNTAVSPAGAIDARFTPAGGLGYGQTYAFFDGEEVTQTAASRLHSFQINRVRLGWDVVQSHLGLRYIWFEDEYDMTTRNIFGESGRLSLQAANHLIGPEVGVKLFYDVGRRISFSSHWKLGGYLNAYRSETYLENDGVPRVNNSDSGTGFSASFDLGANAHIHLTQRMRLRGGYGILWLWDVASVSGNFPYTLTPSSGTSTNDSESAIFHGANVGFEYYW